ncbi:MAG: acylphosphatase [Saprospiraceae bacterium]
MKKHVKVRIEGKVQGVWFRKSTQNKARDLGINGFVRNQTDGSVYVEAEGDEDQIKSFLIWCWEGSPLSEVSAVHSEEADLENFEAFEIQR